VGTVADVPSASVIIPAHNEAAVIGRCLRTLLAGSERGELEVIVVCNGCTDGTAVLARRLAPEAHVVELDVASKVAALNAGDEAASVFPRIYLDADVELGIDAARATMAALGDGAMCAAPLPHHDVAGRPWLIRRFYAAHERLPFFTGPGVVGNGVYALSVEGRRRFGRFPELTADDLFVMEQFRPEERRTLRSHHFTIHTPRTLTGMAQVRTRSYRGNAELHEAFPPAHDEDRAGGVAVVALLRDPAAASGVPVWLAVNAWAKLRARRARARGGANEWERDQSSRTG
jgi:glycosyltransferase involved in cell wall biosynthesis